MKTIIIETIFEIDDSQDEDTFTADTKKVISNAVNDGNLPILDWHISNIDMLLPDDVND